MKFLFLFLISPVLIPLSLIATFLIWIHYLAVKLFDSIQPALDLWCNLLDKILPKND